VRILLTGASGQIGSELPSMLKAHDVVAPSHAELDLSSAGRIRDVVRSVRPDLIVNPAAYTAVDRAEQEPDLARRINALAPAVLAEEARALGVPLIHFSTDYVFDGSASSPYSEDDAPHPLGVYGATKLEGEQAVRATGCIYVILRTSWVYSRTGRNFLLTIERLARERPRLTIVADQHGTPNWSRDLARATASIAQFPRDDLAAKSGLYHLSSQGQTTWHGFARAIVASMQLADPPQVVAITTAEFPTPAKRPAYAVLATARLRETFGIELPHWQSALANCQAGVARW
jgi:dTDP-4-dehydrorhamnose reductase